MIDGIKFAFYHNDFDTYLGTKGVKVFSTFDNSTGVEQEKKYAKHKGLLFEIYKSGRVVVRGSLQIYFKGENYSDFTYYQICQAIDQLCDWIQMKPFKARLSNVEAGVNVYPPFKAFGFCNTVLSYRDDVFTPYKETSTRQRIGLECVNDQYTLKCYDKGKQYGNPNQKEILRYEYAANKMECIKAAGIKTLQDLKDLSKLKILGQKVIETYNEIMVIERVNKSLLSKNELRIYHEYTNPKNWLNYNRKKRDRHKGKYLSIIERFGTTNTKAIIGKLIAEKVTALLSNNSKSGDVLTDRKTINWGRFDSLDKGANRTHLLKRTCNTCNNSFANNHKKIFAA